MSLIFDKDENHNEDADDDVFNEFIVAYFQVSKIKKIVKKIMSKAKYLTSEEFSLFFRFILSLKKNIYRSKCQKKI